MIIGTSHFVSVAAAVAYYRSQSPHDSPKEVRSDVESKIALEEISIGEPKIQTGESLCIVDGGRYAIETREK
jgi:hypothetical protein